MRLYEEGEDRPEIELVREPRHYVYFAAKNGLVGHDAKGGAKKFQLLVLLPVWLVETVVATVDDDKDDEVAVLQSVQGEPSFSSLRVSHLQVNRSLQ